MPAIQPPENKCKIERCGKPAHNEYCTAHLKRWGIFRRRGFAETKFIELMEIDHCELCNAQPLNGLFHIDHDHSCCGVQKWCPKCVRGVVCPRCNYWLGGMDEPGWLPKAQKYLGYYSNRKVMNLDI
jgi:hypothetical protein